MRIDVDVCFPLSGGGEFCRRVEGMFHCTETPSGVESCHYRSEEELTSPGRHLLCKQSEHTLRRDGELQQQTSKVECFTQTPEAGNCHSRTHFHYANGEVQFNRRTLNCTPL